MSNGDILDANTCGQFPEPLLGSVCVWFWSGPSLHEGRQPERIRPTCFGVGIPILDIYPMQQLRNRENGGIMGKHIFISVNQSCERPKTMWMSHVGLSELWCISGILNLSLKWWHKVSVDYKCLKCSISTPTVNGKERAFWTQKWVFWDCVQVWNGARTGLRVTHSPAPFPPF